MSEFIAAADALEGASYIDQKTVRDEVFEISMRLRREMDAGLSPDDMKVAVAEKAAADAAGEILARILEGGFIMSGDFSISEMFAKIQTNLSTQAAGLEDEMNKLANKNEVTEMDMLDMQFKIGRYNMLLEATSTITKSLTDEAKQIAQRAS